MILMKTAVTNQSDVNWNLLKWPSFIIPAALGSRACFKSWWIIHSHHCQSRQWVHCIKMICYVLYMPMDLMIYSQHTKTVQELKTVQHVLFSCREDNGAQMTCLLRACFTDRRFNWCVSQSQTLQWVLCPILVGSNICEMTKKTATYWRPDRISLPEQEHLHP